MRAFRFSLERVKRVREIERDQAKVAWAQSQATVTKIEQELQRAIESASAQSLGLVAGAQFADNTFGSIASRAEWRLMAVNDAKERLATAKEDVIIKQQALQKAQMSLDGMERLRETQFEAWQAEYKTEEAKENDDIVVTRQGGKIAKERKNRTT